jgi:hypothetical protein
MKPRQQINQFTFLQIFYGVVSRLFVLLFVRFGLWNFILAIGFHRQFFAGFFGNFGRLLDFFFGCLV